MSNAFLSEISIWGLNFAPRGWAFCNGQILSVSQYSALYSLLGTNFGGNGTTSFGLPNLQAAAPMQPGQGPGLSQYSLGEAAGQPSVTLNLPQMAIHNHTIQTAIANATAQKTGTPSAAVWLGDSAPGDAYSPNNLPVAPFSPMAIGFSGNNQPHPNVQPVLAVNFCIALQGVFPSRN
jgi:microcystin-dependent protein